MNYVIILIRQIVIKNTNVRPKLKINIKQHRNIMSAEVVYLFIYLIFILIFPTLLDFSCSQQHFVNCNYGAGTSTWEEFSMTLQYKLKGHESYCFEKALILHDNSLFKHLSNTTFSHSPVIISKPQVLSLLLCVYISLYHQCVTMQF